MQSRMRQHDPRKLRQRFPRRRLQIEFAERKQHVRHIHLQPARRIRRRQNAVELIEQRRPQRLLIRLGLRRRISRRLCLLVRTQSLLLRRLCRRIRRQARCIRLRPRLRFPCRVPLRLQPLHFGLLPRRRFLRLLRLCRRRGRRLRRLLRRQLILRRALHRNLPRIRRRLHRVSRRRDHIFPVRFARQHTVRVIQRRQCLLVRIRRQRFRPRRLRNRHRISRFVHFQRNLRRHIRDRFPRLGHVVRVLSALQQLVIRRHLLRRAHRVRAQHVLQHHHVAGHVHRKIWLRRHDHPERLQVGRRRQTAFIAVDHQLSQVARLPFRSDGPQHVRQIFFAKHLRRLQVFKIRADHDRALLAIHLRVALGQRQQRRSAKIDHGRSLLMLVAHRSNRLAHQRDLVERIILLLRTILLRTRQHGAP